MTKEDILHHFQDINFYYNDCMMYDDLSRMLDELIAENKGEWMLLEECSNSGYYCSKCHKKVVKEGWSETVKKIKFCPNCGADMRGD